MQAPFSFTNKALFYDSMFLGFMVIVFLERYSSTFPKSGLDFSGVAK